MGVPVRASGGIGRDRLSAIALERAKAKASPYKLSDGQGLYLLVQPHGSRLWRLKYRHDGRERVYAIGQFPEVSLAQARAERDRAREWIRAGKDPTIERRTAKASTSARQAATFDAIAKEWLSIQPFTADHLRALGVLLSRDLSPGIGMLPIAEITAPQVLEALRKIEKRGRLETAAKCRRFASQIFRYAIVTGRAETDPAALLSKALKAPRTVHRATIAASEMPRLFEAVALVPSERVTKLAFFWLVLNAARTGEMRFATWGEIEQGKLWRVPASRMKMGAEHLVPLSRQAQQILVAAKPLRTSTGADALIFPGFTRHGALSENALLALLARAGFFGRQTSHGFRASFSTWAHEVAEADPDVIEACLAHTRGDIRAVYNRATYLSKRLALLQRWGDQCSAWGMKP